MQAVKSKDSEIELLLRRELWRLGVRYRKHVRSVIGHPDICIKKYRLAIFIDSEFWHGKDWKDRKSDFKSNRSFWIGKIERNIQRDIEVNKALLESGWAV
ncbi:MAG: very short patch repair endonuclease, partial [Ignavibacteriae bacterium]